MKKISKYYSIRRCLVCKKEFIICKKEQKICSKSCEINHNKNKTFSICLTFEEIKQNIKQKLISSKFKIQKHAKIKIFYKDKSLKNHYLDEIFTCVEIENKENVILVSWE